MTASFLAKHVWVLEVAKKGHVHFLAPILPTRLQVRNLSSLFNSSSRKMLRKIRRKTFHSLTPAVDDDSSEEEEKEAAGSSST